jgi:hypothetical protein
MRLVACLLLTSLLLGGCIAPLGDLAFSGASSRPSAPTASSAPSWPAQVGPADGRAMEPHVAARGNVLVAANHAEYFSDAGPATSLFVHRSEDGGRTWSSALLPAGVFAPFDPLGTMKDGGDAVLAYAQDGTLYMAGVALDAVVVPSVAFVIHDLTVFVTRSHDDGRTWEPALFHVRGHGPMLLMQDKPWLEVGADGALHLAWTEFVTPMLTTVKYVRSGDGGETWSAPLDLATGDLLAGTQVSGATLAAPGGGRVYVAALEIRSSVLDPAVASRQVAWWSDDDGATFHGPVGLGPASFPRFGRVAAHGDDPMRAWALVSDVSPQPRMYAVETRDGGLTWSAPVFLAPQRNGTQQHPAVWMEDPGTLHVAYYDAGWPGGERVVLARLEEGAVVEERPAPGDPVRPGPYRREYFGLAHDGDGRLWAAWVGGDGGSEDGLAALMGDAGTGTWVAVAPFEV